MIERSLYQQLCEGRYGSLLWHGRVGHRQYCQYVRGINNQTIKLPQPQKPWGTLDRYLAVLYDTTLYSTDGFVQLDNGSFVFDTFWGEENLYKAGFRTRKRSWITKTLKGDWFSLLLFWSWGYYHWFCDVLPRLHLILEQLPIHTKFIIQSSPPSWMRESLRAIGITDDSTYEYDGKFPLQIQNLYYAPPVAMTGDHDREAINWVRETILNSVFNSTTDREIGVQRIYLSRSKASTRAICNEDEIMHIFSRYGYKKVVAEDMKFADQVRLFKSCTHLIAPHGAGLTNMIYMNQGSRIMEIFDQNTIRRCYSTLSSALGHDYRAVVGLQMNQADIYIDPLQVEKLILGS
jgi:hypothetical protein